MVNKKFLLRNLSYSVCLLCSALSAMQSQQPSTSSLQNSSVLHSYRPRFRQSALLVTMHQPPGLSVAIFNPFRYLHPLTLRAIYEQVELIPTANPAREFRDILIVQGQQKGILLDRTITDTKTIKRKIFRLTNLQVIDPLHKKVLLEITGKKLEEPSLSLDLRLPTILEETENILK